MAVPFHVPDEIKRGYVALRGVLGDTAATIEKDLITLYGDRAPKTTFIYKWKDAIRNGVTSFNDAPRPGRPSQYDETDRVILSILEEEPFSSVRSIASKLDLCRETVRIILKEKLGLQKFKCRWVPNILTQSHKDNRILCSRQMLGTIDENGGVDGIITGDEAWFFFDNPSDGQWSKSPSEVRRNVNRTVKSQKVMVTIFWSVNGFHVIEVLPEGHTFDSEYFISLVKMLKKRIFPPKSKRWSKKIYLHLDNAPVHRSRATTTTAQKIGFCMLRHPPYSPDIAPSDFFLFGYIKEKLKNCHYGSTDRLMTAIYNIIDGIPPELIANVMRNWISRLHMVIESDGDYIED